MSNISFAYTPPPATISTIDTNVTMTIASPQNTVYTSFTASRQITLATTGVPAGYQVTLQNINNFDMVIKSSNGSVLTVANSTNCDATVSNGYVIVESLVATPTLPSDWRVVSLYERGKLATFTITMGAATGTGEVEFLRQNDRVTLTLNSAVITTAASGNFLQSAAGALLTRFVNATKTIYATGSFYTNGGNSFGVWIMRTNGSIGCQIPGAGMAGNSAWSYVDSDNAGVFGSSMITYSTYYV